MIKKEDIKVGTQIELKMPMGFLNTIGKVYTIINIDPEEEMAYFEVPMSDYTNLFVKSSQTTGLSFTENVVCKACLSFEELEQYFFIITKKELKEWKYCDDNGYMITTKDTWSKWLHCGANFIYNSVFDESSTIVECKYRISRDGKIQMRSIDFSNQNIMPEFQSMLKRKEKTYFASSYAICNKEYDSFNRTTGLNLAKMRMRVKLAEMEANFVIRQLHEEN